MNRLAALPGLVLMALSALAFSLMAACIKVAVTGGMPASEIVFFRGVLCGLFTFAAMRAMATSLRSSRYKLLLLRGFFGFAGLYLYSKAIEMVPLPDAMALQYTHPIFAAVLAGMFLGERMPRHAVLALMICAAGAAIILNPTGTGDLAGNLVGLGSGIASALAYVCVRALSRTESPLMIMLAFHIAAAVFGAIAMTSVFVPPSTAQWVWLIAIAAFSQTGQWFLTHGLRKEQAGVATMVGYLAIAFGAAWAFLFFGERTGAEVILGTGLMVCGLGWMNAGRSWRPTSRLRS